MLPTEEVIVNSEARGSVTATGANSWIGGFVGVNAGFISMSSIAKGNVHGTSNSVVGGFAGVNLGQLTAVSTMGSTSFQSVSVSGANNVVGGLVGVNFGTVLASVANSNVSGPAGNAMGSLVGANANMANVPQGLVFGSNFPTGTVIASNGNGTVNGSGGPQIGTLNLTSIVKPSLLDQCTDALCELLKNATLVQGEDKKSIDEIIKLPPEILMPALLFILADTKNDPNPVGAAIITLPADPAAAPAGGQGGSTNVNTASTNNGSTGVRTVSQTPGAPPPAPPPPPLRPVAGPDGERFSLSLIHI